MKRDFDALREGPFDVLVVGGGVYGAWIALDAVRRGLRVAVVDARDWASGTSSRSSKLIHGGLRYLERLHVGLVRKALHERRHLTMLAPHRIKPLRFALPVFRGQRAGKLKLKIGLALYDWLAGGDQPVPGHESLSARRFRDRYEFLAADGLRGGFTYGDCGTDDARLVLEVIATAVAEGAVAVNYAEVEGWMTVQGRRGRRLCGARIRDVESDRSHEVEARVIVNATGAWASKLTATAIEAAGRADSARPSAVRMTKGVHLVLPAMPTDDAFLLTARSDGRVFFLIPWYGRTLLGTTDTNFTDAPADVRVTEADVDYLLREAGHAVGALGWSASDVGATFAGLRVLQAESDRSPSSVTREWTLDEPMAGFLVPVGGKLTSARVEAGVVVDRILTRLDRPAASSRTETPPLVWAPDDGAGHRAIVARGASAGLDLTAAAWLADRFGTSAEAVLDVIRAEPAFAARIHPDFGFVWAEVVHAVEHEMARTLADVLRRRIPLGILARLDDEMIEKAVHLIGDRLDWSAERRRAECQGDRGTRGEALHG